MSQPTVPLWMARVDQRYAPQVFQNQREHFTQGINPDTHKHAEAIYARLCHVNQRMTTKGKPFVHNVLASPEEEQVLAQSAVHAFLYAHYILKKPFPQGEPWIAQSPDLACAYATHVLKGAFPQAEHVLLGAPPTLPPEHPAVAQREQRMRQVMRADIDPWKALRYLRLIHAPLEQQEPWFAKDSYLSYAYAREKGGRFLAGESEIARDPIHALLYAKYVLKGRFKAAESCIYRDIRCTYLYARFVWHSAKTDERLERLLLSEATRVHAHTSSRDFHAFYKYAKFVVQGRCPRYERALLRLLWNTTHIEPLVDFSLRYLQEITKKPDRYFAHVFAIKAQTGALPYAQTMLKGRYPEWENRLWSRPVDASTLAYLDDLQHKPLRSINDRAHQLALEFRARPHSETCRQLCEKYKVSYNTLSALAPESTYEALVPFFTSALQASVASRRPSTRRVTNTNVDFSL